MNIIQGLVYRIIMYNSILQVSVTNHFCIGLFMYGIVYLYTLEIVILRDYLKGYIRLPLGLKKKELFLM